MNEFYQNNIIIVWVIAFAIEVAMGLFAQVIAERKGHSKRWFWAGFFFSLVGVVWAAGLPDETLRRQMKQLHEKRPAGGNAQPSGIHPKATDDTELIAVLAAAIAAIGVQQGKQFILRSFRPAGAGSTAWNRASRGRAHASR